MKHELTLWYSVQNGGDGSAYPTFMESEELTQWDQDHLWEGWGETCNGSITVYSDSPITTTKDVVTSLSYLIEMIDSEDDNLEEFLEEFFPNGTPKMDVEVEEIKNESKYAYNLVTADGKLVDKFFRRIEESGKKFEKLINQYTPKTLADNMNMTTTAASLSAEQVKESILRSKGQFVKVKWQSDPKPAAAFKAFNLKKITEGVCRAGIDYANLGVVKEGIESGERGEVQALPWGQWKVVDGVSQFPYVIEHKGVDYIRLYPSIHKPYSIFYVNDKEVDKSTFASYLTPSESAKLLNPQGEDVPLCFTIKSENILSIPEEVPTAE